MVLGTIHHLPARRMRIGTTMLQENLPELNPPRYGDVLDANRPILSFSWQKDGPHRAAAHAHPRAHIIQPGIGAIWAVTPEGTWLVPSGQALWIPPFVHHEVYTHDTVAARMIFVDPQYTGSMPARCGTVQVSSLLSQLLQKALEYGNEYPPNGPESRLAQVMLDELAAMKVAPLLIPLSKEPRLAPAMQRLIDNPGSQEDIEKIARETGASARTLARLFRSEVGMTFTQWRTRLRLVESVDRLQRGDPVTQVAFDLGYESPSAFVYMFRSNMGMSPGNYVKREIPSAVG